VTPYPDIVPDMKKSIRTSADLKAAIREANDYKFALDQSTIFAITDTKGVITYVNDMFCQISQYERDELLGKTHQIVNSGHHPKKFWQSMWRDISRGQVWRGEVKNQAKDGSEYWVNTTIVPFLDDNGRPIKYAAIRDDVTAKKLAEREIESEHAKTIYAEKMASLGEMSAGIAHEIGNPLGAIRGRMEMIRQNITSDSNPEEALEDIDKVLGLTDRISKIIKGLRSYARDGSSDPFTPSPINKVLTDLVELSGAKLKFNGVDLILKGFEQDVLVECRETEICQVFINLTNNAIDAVQSLPEKWLEFELINFENKITINVTDSGHGISQSKAQKIFEPFYTSKAAGSGTGLGLSIAKKIIENHHGSFFIDHDWPNTRFTIVLPKTQAQSS
jgi:PAS domain S-box-containing protein